MGNKDKRKKDNIKLNKTETIMKVYKKIFTVLAFLCICQFAFAAADGEILPLIPANPDKGFHWGYYLYLPKNIDYSKKQTIVIIPCNVPVATNNDNEIENRIRKDIETNQSVYEVPDGLAAPMLMPIFPRGSDDMRDMHIHNLDRDVMFIKEGKLKRIDLQLIKMFEDARDYLEVQYGINTNKKFFITGYSGAGNFTSKMVILHPKYIVAAVSGGSVGLPPLPLEEYNGTKLIFSVGIADLDKLGIKFNKEAYQKVPQYIYHGAKDNNDPMRNSDVYGEEEKDIIRKVLSENISARWKKSRELISSVTKNVQFHTYPDIGHKPVTEDVVKFLKANSSGGTLNKIEPTDSALP
jgi:hypothetical protein